MGKTLQFRCPNCSRLLIKWEVGKENCVYKAIEMDKDGRTKCTKCGLALIFKENKFVADTGKNVAPLNISRPTHNIVAPAKQPTEEGEVE